MSDITEVKADAAKVEATVVAEVAVVKADVAVAVKTESKVVAFVKAHALAFEILGTIVAALLVYKIL